MMFSKGLAPICDKFVEDTVRLSMFTRFKKILDIFLLRFETRVLKVKCGQKLRPNFALFDSVKIREGRGDDSMENEVCLRLNVMGSRRAVWYVMSAN